MILLTTWLKHETYTNESLQNINKKELIPIILSLQKKLDEVNNSVLSEMRKSRISRTNFSPTNIALANYIIERTPTESNTGGALLYINRKQSYKIQKDLTLYKPHKTESVFVEVIMPKRSNVIVGFIYRQKNFFAW